MQRLVLFVAIFIGLTSTGFAQSVHTSIHKAERAGTVVLKDMEDKYSARVYNLEAPEPDGEYDKEKLEEAKKESAKLFPRRVNTAARNKTTAANSPIVSASFLSDSVSGIPPDNDMAISKGGDIVSVRNSLISTLNTSGNVNSRTLLKTYAAPAGLNGVFNNNKYDPKVVYDSDADRFISIMLHNTNETNYVIVGFSQSNDPQGTWAFYTFYGDYKNDSTWFDYPGVAITKDELFLTGNKIGFSQPWQTGFSETVIYQISKSDGYSNATNVTYKIWDGIKHNGQSIRNLFPVKSGYNPDGPSQYFLSNRNFDVQNDTIFLVKVPDVLGSGNNNLTVQVLKSPTSYGVPPNGRQKDTSVVLSTNDGRILGAYAIYDEIQFVSTSVDPVSGASAIYHARITDYKNNPSIPYAGFFSIDTLDFGYPNISFVGNTFGLNQSLINFNFTGPNEFAGMGAILFDGTQYSDLVKIKTGDSIIKILSGKEQRWGDYTGSQVDFNTQGAVWVEGIFGQKDTRYGSWIAQLNSPLLSVKDQQKKVANTAVYPNPAILYVDFKFDLQESGVINFAIYNMQGQVVDKLLDTYCEEGVNLLRFNIASLPTGNYFIKATAEEGATVINERFVKQ